MQKLALFPVSIALLLCGCHTLERASECPPIGDTTRILVHNDNPEPNGDSDYVIKDPDRVSALIAFSNPRRDCYQPSLYKMPLPTINVTFYNKQQDLGSLGAGSNFFYISCSNWKGVRSATTSELSEFNRLAAEVEQ